MWNSTEKKHKVTRFTCFPWVSSSIRDKIADTVGHCWQKSQNMKWHILFFFVLISPQKLSRKSYHHFWYLSSYLPYVLSTFHYLEITFQYLHFSNIKPNFSFHNRGSLFLRSSPKPFLAPVKQRVTETHPKILIKSQ